MTGLSGRNGTLHGVLESGFRMSTRQLRLIGAYGLILYYQKGLGRFASTRICGSLCQGSFLTAPSSSFFAFCDIVVQFLSLKESNVVTSVTD